jgi:hypothetical protein
MKAAQTLPGMHALALWIRPTSALTFRVLPGSIRDIATYPFVPPTTLSGWLRRLFWAREGLLPPDWKEGNAPRFYVLPRRYVPLGAYPVGGMEGSPHPPARPQELQPQRVFPPAPGGQTSQGRGSPAPHLGVPSG